MYRLGLTYDQRKVKETQVCSIWPSVLFINDRLISLILTLWSTILVCDKNCLLDVKSSTDLFVCELRFGIFRWEEREREEFNSLHYFLEWFSNYIYKSLKFIPQKRKIKVGYSDLREIRDVVTVVWVMGGHPFLTSRSSVVQFVYSLSWLVRSSVGSVGAL